MLKLGMFVFELGFLILIWKLVSFEWAVIAGLSTGNYALARIYLKVR